jgi:hypothetical protein
MTEVPCAVAASSSWCEASPVSQASASTPLSMLAPEPAQIAMVFTCGLLSVLLASMTVAILQKGLQSSTMRTILEGQVRFDLRYEVFQKSSLAEGDEQPLSRIFVPFDPRLRLEAPPTRIAERVRQEVVEAAVGLIQAAMRRVDGDVPLDALDEAVLQRHVLGDPLQAAEDRGMVCRTRWRAWKGDGRMYRPR